MVRIEAAGAEHVPAIARMYAVEAERGYATFDVEGLSEAVWEERRRSSGAGDALLVALGENGAGRDGVSAVLGFAWSHPYRPKPAYGSTRETTVYVSPAEVGQGIGTVMYAELLRRIGAAGIHLVVAGIAEPNPSSRRLHQRAGFSLVGTMTEVGHKFGRYYDVSWWQRRMS